MTDQITAIDLYAGAGGATQGLTDAGIRVLAAVENNPAAASTFRANHGAVRMLDRDIRKVRPTRLRRQLRLEPGQLGIIQACPPCPSWSTLGEKSKDDPRRELIQQVGRFIRAFSPRAFIIENVPGLAADPRLAKLLTQARARGYSTNTYLVEATDAGVPQRRRRLIAIGVRGLDDANWPKDLLDAVPEGFDRTSRNVQDAFARLVETAPDNLSRGRSHTPPVVKRIEAIPVDGTRFDLPIELQLTCHQDVGRSAAASYGRLRLTEPAPTLTTRCTTPACGRFVHPTEHRGITLREAALLQTFPPRYAFSGFYDQIERQIGNAIPVRLAEAVARATVDLVGKVA